MTRSTIREAGRFGPFSFYKQALALALPVMAQLLIQSAVSLVDNFMVAGLGDIKMSGVNIVGQINFVFWVLANSLCMSGGIFMSQYNGAKDPEGMQQAFRFKLIVVSAAAILYTFFCFFWSKPALGLMVGGNRESNAIITEGFAYMRLIAFTWIPTSIAMSIGSSMREIGQVRVPLIISIIATLINTFFNWVLIYGNLGAPSLEVKGAALATIIARSAEAVIFVVYMRRVKPPFYFRLRRIFMIKWHLFMEILKKSGMILTSEMSWALTETIVTALYNGRGGAEIVSGMSAGFAIANLFFICFSGIHTAVGVIMGSSLGANELDRARIQKRWLLSGAAVFGLFMGFLGSSTIFLIPLVFANLSMSAQIVTRNMVLVNAFYLFPWSYLNGQFAVSRIGGATMMGVLTDLSTNFLLVLPGMFLLTFLTDLGPVTLYWLIKLTDFVKIAIAVFWLKKERWVKNLTV